MQHCVVSDPFVTVYFYSFALRKLAASCGSMQ